MKQPLQKLDQIQTMHETGKKAEAEKALKKWTQENPNIGIGYEIQCEWELEKKNPNMKKIAEILNEADDQDTYVENEMIYKRVIQYYEQQGDKERENYYRALLHFKNMFSKEAYDEEEYWDEEEEDDWEYDDDFDEDMYWDDDDDFDFEEEQKQDLIEDLRELATDRVKPNKKIEQYMEDYPEDEILAFLGPQGVMKTTEEIEEKEKHVKQYIIQNYDNIMKENLVYLPTQLIKTIQDMPSTGVIKQNLEERTFQEVLELQAYFLLKGFGIAFIAIKGDEIIIHIPHIKALKTYLQDTDILKRNAIFNEKANIMAGICEMHGAIKVKQLEHILQAFYGEQDKILFAKTIIIIELIFGKIGLKIDRKTGNLQYIYHYMLNEKEAKTLLKNAKELETYSKEDYLKHSTEIYIKDTKSYKKLEKEIENTMPLGKEVLESMGGILLQYCVQKRLGAFKAERLLEEIQNMLTLIQEEEEAEFYIEPKLIRRGFKEIANELPQWK